MSWFPLAISAYFFLAIASVGDRFFLTGSLKDTKVYSFYVGLAPILVVPFFLPFARIWPDSFTLLIGLLFGLLWIGGVWAYFSAIASSEVSRVVPATGAFITVFTLFGALLFSNETLFPKEFLALALLIAGGVLITAQKFSLRYFLRGHIFTLIIPAAFLFASTLLLIKAVFLRLPFVEGFLVLLMGRALASLLFLLFPAVRNEIFARRTGFKKQVAVPFAFFQSAGGFGSFLQIVSISLAKIPQISLINALEGTRYLFLFIFVWILAKRHSGLLKEEMGGAVLYQKIVAGGFIVFGVLLLAV